MRFRKTEKSHFKELENMKKSVKFIRMDNAGENTKLRNRTKKEEMNVNIEFTSPNTPQFNEQIERSFVTLWGRAQAMLNGASY